MRILMVEDEKLMAKACAEVLRKSYYTIDLVHDGDNGLEYALSDIYDIIILDIMLPKKDGLTILKEIRLAKIDTPILLLTAKDSIEDKVMGLDNGADDYLAKPFHIDELLARIRALQRRKPVLLSEGIIFSDIVFYPELLRLECSGNETILKLKESQILEFLINNRNTVISKNTIIEKIWGYESDAEDNNVETHVSRLRKQLSGIHSRVLISTIRRVGYTLSEGIAEDV